MRTLGIDLSADPAKTGACEVDWDVGTRLSRAAAACLDGCDDDGLDAFVCAVVARAALAGQTIHPGPEHLDVARREGWIHVPTGELTATFWTE